MYDNGIRFVDEGTVDGQQYVTVLDRGGNVQTYHQPRWKANWDFKRRYSPAIAAMMDNWDSGDPWGSAMSMAWAVATVARAIDNSAPAVTLSVSWGMEPQYSIEDLAGDDETGEIQFETNCLADAVQDGRVTEDDLNFAARVLSRYLHTLETAGLSY